jgi:hypothetical protein
MTCRGILKWWFQSQQSQPWTVAWWGGRDVALSAESQSLCWLSRTCSGWTPQGTFIWYHVGNQQLDILQYTGIPPSRSLFQDVVDDSSLVFPGDFHKICVEVTTIDSSLEFLQFSTGYWNFPVLRWFWIMIVEMHKGQRVRIVLKSPLTTCN